MVLKLTTAPTLRESSLVMAYEVENTGDASAYLANGISDWFGDQQAPASTARAYVNHGGEGLAVFLQGFVRPPRLLSAARGRPPMFTVLPPGGRFATEIVADLPLLEWDAFRPPSEDQTWPVDITTVEVRIDVRLEPSTVFEDPSFGDFVGVSGGEASVVATTASLPAPVRLFRRVDEFDRF
jgi:hypothetical protein